MKCTLRKVDGGIVATTLKIPKIGQLCYSIKYKKIIEYAKKEYSYQDKCMPIIASTIQNVGKKLAISAISLLGISDEEYAEILEGVKEHSYTETETQVIIEL